MEQLPQSIGILFSGIVGLLLGSFATMVCYRLPRGEEMVIKRSHCTQCLHVLSVFDLLPLVSWVIRAGQCHYCKSRIDYRYPLIELLVASLCIASYMSVGWTLLLPLLYFIVVCLVIISVIDIQYRIIPDSLQGILALFAVVYRLMQGGAWQEIVGGAALGLAIGLVLRYGYYFLRHREGLGLGDVKFFIVAGLFLDLQAFVLFMFYSGIVGTVLGICWKIIKKESLFPFAPALCIALLICILMPKIAVVSVYAHIFNVVNLLIIYSG